MLELVQRAWKHVFSIWIPFTERHFLLLGLLFGARKILPSPCLTADASDNIQWLANAVVTPAPQTGAENKRTITTEIEQATQDTGRRTEHSVWTLSPLSLPEFSVPIFKPFLSCHKKSEFEPLKSSHTWQEQLAWIGEGKFLCFLPRVVTTRSF